MGVPRSAVLFLAVGLLAASQSGNLVRLADAHPAVMAGYRLVLSALLLAPLAGPRLAAVARLRGRELVLLVLAGAALAGHLVTWIAAVQHTTVANAAVFFALNPVTTALCAHVFLRERLDRRLLAGVVVGFAGVAVLGGGDLRFGREHLVGDGLAVACAILFTVYFLLGRRLRQALDNRVYVTVLYGVAGLSAFACGAVRQAPVHGFTARTWLAFLLLALVPTMIGHTSFNHALRYLDAGRVSVLTLSEPLFAGAVAWAAWGEAVNARTVAGYVLVSAAVLVVLSSRPRQGGADRVDVASASGRR
jgi:drug/metabolite transporter (DMT)-like permease